MSPQLLDLETCERQLKRVDELLVKDPENEKLLKLKSHLSRAVELLYHKQESIPVVPATITKIVDIVPAVVSQSSVFKTGDRVEVRDPINLSWKLATVHVASTLCVTVIMDHDGSVRHMTDTQDIARIRPEEPINITHTFNDQVISPVNASIPIVTEVIATSNKKKRDNVQDRMKRPTRAEYLIEKEREQTQKQVAWQQFAQKLKKK